MATATPTSTSAQQSGCYVYGILPPDVKLTEDVRGVGGRGVKLVHTDALAALVSTVDLVGPIGTPDDLRAHQQVLDAVAAGAPVLPLRFGAVLTNEDAVLGELLEANQDDFVAALDQLEGQSQFVVKGRYVESAIFEEILGQDREAAQLRQQIRGKDADATRQDRMQLGEIVSSAVTSQREDDTHQVLSRMADYSAASVVREPTHELDAVNVAFLVDADGEGELRAVVEELSGSWDGRVKFRLQGPMAPYDFVGAAPQVQSQGEGLGSGG